MLATIFAPFKGIFSRSFWFGSFLPVLITTFVHAFLTAIVFQPPSLTPASVLSLGAADGTRMMLLVATLVLLAYVLSPFVPLFRGVLDGSLLPQRLYDALRDGRRPAWRRATDAFRAHRNRFARSDRLDQGLQDLSKLHRDNFELTVEDQAGITLADTAISDAEAAVHALADKDEGLSNLVPAAFAEWWDRGSERLKEDLDLFETAEQKLVTALGAHSTDVRQSGDAGKRAARLGQAHLRFDVLMRERAEEDRRRFEAAARRHAGLDLRGWEATRLAEHRRATERYVQELYTVEFDWLWPRLFSVLPDQDTGLALRVRDANAQLDFAVLLVALFQTVPLVWLPLLLIVDRLDLFLAVGWLVPLVNAGLYALAVQSQCAFGVVIEAAVDQHRFDLLTKLHQPLPTTLSAERRLWKALSDTAAPGFKGELIYEAPRRP